MKVTQHLENAKKTLFSFEIIPPQKGQNINSLYANIDPLMEFNPPFIDVTTSREETIYIEKDNGFLEPKIIRKRPGTVGICASIMHKYDVDTVPHVLCGGFSREETEYVLFDLSYLGIDNVLALRGDKAKSEQYFSAHQNGNNNAIDLVSQIQKMNNGKFLYDEIDSDYNMNFCIGVAGYPEKHFEAPNLQTDLDILRKKVEAGAEYVVTQMFFDNAKYFDFVKKCRENGINVPIIPGIKPISIAKHLQILPQIFHLDLPHDLVIAIQSCKDNKSVRQVGIEWATMQTKQLIDAGVPCVHFYSMGKSSNIYEIAKQTF